MAVQIKQTQAGLELGKRAADHIGFHGAAPVRQRSGSIQTALAMAVATGVLTFTARPANNDPFVVGATTYTWKTALTGAANEVLIGATEATAIANAAAALNAAAGIGATYGAGTVANASASAVAGATTLTVSALLAGTPGNSVATTTTSTACSWGHATLQGGTDPTLAQLGLLVNELQAALVTKGLIKGSA